jgi:hypothetical protein
VSGEEKLSHQAIPSEGGVAEFHRSNLEKRANDLGSVLGSSTNMHPVAGLRERRWQYRKLSTLSTERHSTLLSNKLGIMLRSGVISITTGSGSRKSSLRRSSSVEDLESSCVKPTINRRTKRSASLVVHFLIVGTRSFLEIDLQAFAQSCREDKCLHVFVSLDDRI